MNKVLINIRRISFTIFLFLILCSCFSCKKEQKVIIPDYTVFPSEMKGMIANKKLYVTSIGQSSDMGEFVDYTLVNLDIKDTTIDSFLKANDVEKGSAVVLFVGCSIKGLAESETTIDKELERASQFVEKAKADNFTLICFHIGGESRRGLTSDQFIKLLFAASDLNVFLDRSDSDLMLSTVSYENNVPAYIIKNTLSMENLMEMLYNINGDN